MPAGVARHGRLVGAFILLGQIAQGVADAAFEANGADGGSSAETYLLRDTMALARAVIASWGSGFSTLTRLPAIDSPGDLPARVTLRQPEGYAFYALYPETYAEAARRIVLRGRPQVIGIRSIGSSLAAMVAAALDAPVPLTVRPIGHPFDRRIALDEAARARLGEPGLHHLVVDEGPGLSGSSFAAVVAALRAEGVPADHITMLPSHGGEPGPRAGEATRRCWAEVGRSVVTIDNLGFVNRLAQWAEPLLGPLKEPPIDISGGRWRHYRYADARDWPAVEPGLERRKFLATTLDGGRWLLKFAGLGEEGTRKLHRARLLAAAGMAPEVKGLLHGFLVQSWIDQTGDTAPSAERVAAYLASRARLLPRPKKAGASIESLFDMAVFNLRKGLGSAAADAFVSRHAPSPALAQRVEAIAIDGRMDACEWLAGRKADALDHDAGPDLIGPQDIAWDVAGAIVELDIDADHLLARLDPLLRRPVDRDLLRFLQPAYIAFRLGLAGLAGEALADGEERRRNDARIHRYGRKLLL